ncbi:MAG: hypothetical protein AABO58_01915 [Acidobacteriota bacterium]
MQRLLVLVALLSLATASLVAQEVTGSPAVTAQYQDPETIERITLRLAGQGRESWETVIADGEPALTWGTVAAFSLLLHEVFDAQLTEAEGELIAKRFAESYAQSDPDGRKALTGDWKQMLEALGGGAARGQVRAKLEARIAGAKGGWGVAVREALDRRNRVVAKSAQPRPQWAGAAFDASMSVADLDASIELLYFMWVAAGRDPELVTLENVALIRNHFLHHFAELPGDMQYALANAQKIYAGLRVLWYTGNGQQRAAMARNFNQELNLGLPDPNGGGQSASGSSDAHGAFAAEMVVGLAGSSYKSAW